MAPRPSSRSDRSSAPTSSPRPQMRDQAKAQAFIESRDDGGSNAAATAAQSPAVRQGIASIFGGGQQSSGGSFNPLNFGVMGIARNLIESLASGDGTPTTRPQMRPSVMQVGEEPADRRLVATRDMPRFGFSVGDTAPVPDYSPFSMRGLTSTDPGNVMRNIMGAERQMRNMPMGGGEDAPAPVQPVTPPVDANAMPTERPAWWPAYLPWPPAPPAAAPVPTYVPPPVAPAMQVPQYSTSYSSLQNVISGARNPLMMGIGGMIRRP